MKSENKNKEEKYTPADELIDEIYGKPGKPKREQFEFELSIALLGEKIKEIRKARNLTQGELGKLVGVQKAQISKLESNSSNVTIDTILKLLKALDAKVSLKISLLEPKGKAGQLRAGI